MLKAFVPYICATARSAAPIRMAAATAVISGREVTIASARIPIKLSDTPVIVAIFCALIVRSGADTKINADAIAKHVYPHLRECAGVSSFATAVDLLFRNNIYEPTKNIPRMTTVAGLIPIHLNSVWIRPKIKAVPVKTIAKLATVN